MFRLKADTPPLSESEEKELFKLYKTGTEDEKNRALDKLLDANLKLVFKIAHEFKHCPLAFDDLVAEGCTGLMHAAEKFDTDKGVRFITYAVWWIRQRMRKAIEYQGRTVRVPQRANVTKAKMLHSMSELTDILGHKPTTQELADFVEMPEAYVRDVLYSLGQSISLDIPQDSEDNEMSVSDQVHVRLAEDFGDIIANKELVEAFKKVFKKLSMRDQYILTLRYGLDGSQPATLEETAQEVGKCRERIRQLQAEALVNLRAKLKEHKEK